MVRRVGFQMMEPQLSMNQNGGFFFGEPKIGEFSSIFLRVFIGF